MTEQRVPVTLLTGFLGAGKSTFLNKILSRSDAGRIAVIVNEFGDVGLDHELIEAAEEDITLLASGCICCSIRSDLVKALPELIARRARGELAFDRIVIETTGLAEPGPIQHSFVKEPELARQVYLDGIVTLADALVGPKSLDEHFEAVSQAAMADLILLSKTDIASDQQIGTIRARLERLNAGAKILEAQDVAQNPQLLWGRSAVRQGATLAEALDWIAPPSPAPFADPLANLSGLGVIKAPAIPVASPLDGRIVSASTVLDKPLDRNAFFEWLDGVVFSLGDSILRIKGIIFLKGVEMPTAFHCVQHHFDRPQALTHWAGDDRKSRIVIIAQDVSENRLRRAFRKLDAL